MKFYARTETGRVRPINEDSFYPPAAGEKFCAVADGMGGHNAGEVASALAIEVFSKHMRDHKGRAMPETLRTGRPGFGIPAWKSGNPAKRCRTHSGHGKKGPAGEPGTLTRTASARNRPGQLIFLPSR